MLALALAVSCGGTSAASQEPAARPDVLVIVLDDLSEVDVDVIPTPRLDGLAARGMRFRRAYAAPVCSPARRMLTFGTYWMFDSGSPCDGETRPWMRPSTAALSLPRLFKDAGYHTGLFGKWHLGDHDGVDQGEPWELAPQRHGFDVWRAGMSSNIRTTCVEQASYASWQRVDDGVTTISGEYNTWAIRDAALGWLEEVRGDERPWFALVCFQAPHGPFHTPPGMLRPKNAGLRASFEMMVTAADAAIGDLLDRVDPERTLVVLVSDNGTPGPANGPLLGGRGGKTATYEGGIRVPMVWAGPGVPRGVESDALVSLVDVLPTMADVLGAGQAAAAAALDGLSLVSAFGEPGRAVHDLVWAGFRGDAGHPLGEFAVVSERWKVRLSGEDVSVFDLLEDPGERRNLRGQPRAREAQEQLLAHLRAVNATLEVAPHAR